MRSLDETGGKGSLGPLRKMSNISLSTSDEWKGLGLVIGKNSNSDSGVFNLGEGGGEGNMVSSGSGGLLKLGGAGNRADNHAGGAGPGLTVSVSGLEA